MYHIHPSASKIAIFVSKLKKIPKSNQQQQKPRWQDNKKDDFLLNIDQNKLFEIQNLVQNMHNNHVDLENINSICNEIGQVFKNSADQSFPTLKTASSRNKKSYNLL